MQKNTLSIIVTLLLGLFVGACRPSQADLDSQATQVAANVFATQTAEAPAATPTPEPTATPEPVPTATPTFTPTPGPLTPNEIFSLISPSVVFVETQSGTGSGVLIDGGYIVTNSHVVWPFDNVRVVFPDGSEFVDAPVLGWDLIADLAVIGPLDTNIESVELVDGEASIIGSDVYLIGYPAEVEEFPQPTISRGLISRLREWEPVEMTFFQTDASIAGGQSGGILVSEKGEVIGISGFRIGEGEFGIVASAADANIRIQGLLNAEDVDGLGPRRLLAEERVVEQEIALAHFWDAAFYVINEPPDTELEIAVKGDNDIAFWVTNILGDVITVVDDHNTGEENTTFTTELEAPYFLTLFMDDEEADEFELNSSHGLIPYKDTDDDGNLNVGETFAGHIDYPRDLDYFNIELEEGETIAITVDSLLIDSLVSATYWDDQENELVTDDDGGGGFFGLNAELIYEAAYTGRHLIIVEDATGYGSGGYFLQVEEASDDDIPAKPDRAPEPVDTPYGEMTPFELPPYPFTFLRPSDWELDTEESPVCRLVTACYVNEGGSLVAIAIEDLTSVGLGEMSRERYVDLVLSVIENAPGFELISREEVEVQPGLSGEILELSLQGGLLRARRFIYLHAGTLGINISYITNGSRFDELNPLIQYSFDSFELLEPGEGEADADFYVDQGMTFLSMGETEKAIEAFSEAIALNPEEAEAYRRRAGAYSSQDDYDGALADIDKAIELDPENAELYHNRGFYYWMQSDFDSALTNLDKAIELDDQSDGAYNMRALVYAIRDEYENALADVNRALELRQVGSGDADLLDTRGFIYIKSGDYEKAKADFEAIFDQGLSFSYAQLGGGLTYAALGETDRAIDLLEAGLEGVTDVEWPGPQLAELIMRAERVLSELK